MYVIYSIIHNIYIGFCPTFRQTHLDQVHQYIPSLQWSLGFPALHPYLGFPVISLEIFHHSFSGPYMRHRKIIAWYPWKQSQLQPLHGGFLNWWYLHIIKSLDNDLVLKQLWWLGDSPILRSLPKKNQGQLHPAPVAPVPSGQMGGNQSLPAGQHHEPGGSCDARDAEHQNRFASSSFAHKNNP